MIATFRKSFIVTLIINFVGLTVHLPNAHSQNLPWMPVPGVRVALSVPFTPATLKGMVVHQNDALRFDFLIQKGDELLSESKKKDEYQKLIKYFMASLTVPDDNQWVNLSPYEKNRIIEKDFAQTEMGRNLLAQDYLLKQITASLMYPEESLGKKFWDRVFTRARQELGTTNVPMNTFNKVWILPEHATVYEKGNTVYILDTRLKVMMEEDYLALDKNSSKRSLETELNAKQQASQPSSVSSKVVREIIIPELEREVNEGKNFAPLRQIYSGMILSAWYKRALKESLLSKIYADRAKVKGVNIDDPKENDAIYQKYLTAYKKGVFNYIKEDIDAISKQPIPRKYFSGGALKYKWVDYAQMVQKLNSDQVIRVQNELSTVDAVEAKVVTEAGSSQKQARESITLRTLNIAQALLGSNQNFLTADRSNDNNTSEKFEEWFRDVSGLIKRSSQPFGLWYKVTDEDLDKVKKVFQVEWDQFNPDTASQRYRGRVALRPEVVKQAIIDKVIIPTSNASKKTLDFVKPEIAFPVTPGLRQEVTVTTKNNTLKLVHKGEENSAWVFADNNQPVTSTSQTITLQEEKVNFKQGSDGALEIFYVVDYTGKGNATVSHIILPSRENSAMSSNTRQILETLQTIKTDKNRLDALTSQIENLGVEGFPSRIESPVQLMDFFKRTWLLSQTGTQQENALAYEALSSPGSVFGDIYTTMNTNNPNWTVRDIEDIQNELEIERLNMLQVIVAERILPALEDFESDPPHVIGQYEIAANALAREQESEFSSKAPSFQVPESPTYELYATAYNRESDSSNIAPFDLSREEFKAISDVLREQKLEIKDISTMRKLIVEDAGGKESIRDLQIDTKNALSNNTIEIVKFIPDSSFTVGISDRTSRLANWVRIFKNMLGLSLIAKTKFDLRENKGFLRLSPKSSSPGVKLEPKDDTLGGIDLNAANLNLLIKRDGQGVPLPFSLQDPQLYNQIDGLIPVIINITPVMSLPILSELKQGQALNGDNNNS